MKKTIGLTLGSFIITIVLCVAFLIPYLKKHDQTYQKASAPVPTVTVTKTVTPKPVVKPTPTAPKSPVDEFGKPFLKYGQTYQFAEGIKVTVLGYKTYPKDPTITMGHKYYKLFTIKVKATSKQYHIEEFFMDSAGGEFTETEGNGQPGGQLDAGKTLTITMVFGYDTNDSKSLTFARCPDTVYLCAPRTWA